MNELLVTLLVYGINLSVGNLEEYPSTIARPSEETSNSPAIGGTIERCNATRNLPILSIPLEEENTSDPTLKVKRCRDHALYQKVRPCPSLTKNLKVVRSPNEHQKDSSGGMPCLRIANAENSRAILNSVLGGMSGQLVAKVPKNFYDEKPDNESVDGSRRISCLSDRCGYDAVAVVGKRIGKPKTCRPGKHTCKGRNCVNSAHQPCSKWKNGSPVILGAKNNDDLNDYDKQKAQSSGMGNVPFIQPRASRRISSNSLVPVRTNNAYPAYGIIPIKGYFQNAQYSQPPLSSNVNIDRRLNNADQYRYTIPKTIFGKVQNSEKTPGYSAEYQISKNKLNEHSIHEASTYESDGAVETQTGIQFQNIDNQILPSSTLNHDGIVGLEHKQNYYPNFGWKSQWFPVKTMNPAMHSFYSMEDCIRMFGRNVCVISASTAPSNGDIEPGMTSSSTPMTVGESMIPGIVPNSKFQIHLNPANIEMATGFNKVASRIKSDPTMTREVFQTSKYDLKNDPNDYKQQQITSTLLEDVRARPISGGFESEGMEGKQILSPTNRTYHEKSRENERKEVHIVQQEPGTTEESTIVMANRRITSKPQYTEGETYIDSDELEEGNSEGRPKFHIFKNTLNEDPNDQDLEYHNEQNIDNRSPSSPTANHYGTIGLEHTQNYKLHSKPQWNPAITPNPTVQSFYSLENCIRMFGKNACVIGASTSRSNQNIEPEMASLSKPIGLGLSENPVIIPISKFQNRPKAQNTGTTTGFTSDSTITRGQSQTSTYELENDSNYDILQKTPSTSLQDETSRSDNEGLVNEGAGQKYKFSSASQIYFEKEGKNKLQEAHLVQHNTERTNEDIKMKSNSGINSIRQHTENDDNYDDSNEFEENNGNVFNFPQSANANDQWFEKTTQPKQPPTYAGSIIGNNLNDDPVLAKPVTNHYKPSTTNQNLIWDEHQYGAYPPGELSSTQKQENYYHENIEGYQPDNEHTDPRQHDNPQQADILHEISREHQQFDPNVDFENVYSTPDYYLGNVDRTIDIKNPEPQSNKNQNLDGYGNHDEHNNRELRYHNQYNDFISAGEPASREVYEFPENSYHSLQPEDIIQNTNAMTTTEQYEYKSEALNKGFNKHGNNIRDSEPLNYDDRMFDENGPLISENTYHQVDTMDETTKLHSNDFNDNQAIITVGNEYNIHENGDDYIESTSDYEEQSIGKYSDYKSRNENQDTASPEDFNEHEEHDDIVGLSKNHTIAELNFAPQNPPLNELEFEPTSNEPAAINSDETEISINPTLIIGRITPSKTHRPSEITNHRSQTSSRREYIETDSQSPMDETTPQENVDEIITVSPDMNSSDERYGEGDDLINGILSSSKKPDTSVYTVYHSPNLRPESIIREKFQNEYPENGKSHEDNKDKELTGSVKIATNDDNSEMREVTNSYFTSQAYDNFNDIQENEPPVMGVGPSGHDLLLENLNQRHNDETYAVTEKSFDLVASEHPDSSHTANGPSILNEDEAYTPVVNLDNKIQENINDMIQRTENTEHSKGYIDSSEKNDYSSTIIEEPSPTNVLNSSTESDELAETTILSQNFQDSGYYTGSSNEGTYSSVMTADSLHLMDYSDSLEENRDSSMPIEQSSSTDILNSSGENDEISETTTPKNIQNPEYYTGSSNEGTHSSSVTANSFHLNDYSDSLEENRDSSTPIEESSSTDILNSSEENDEIPETTTFSKTVQNEKHYIGSSNKGTHSSSVTANSFHLNDYSDSLEENRDSSTPIEESSSTDILNSSEENDEIPETTTFSKNVQNEKHYIGSSNKGTHSSSVTADSLHLNDYSDSVEENRDSSTPIEESSPTDILNSSEENDEIPETTTTPKNIQNPEYYTGSSNRGAHPSMMTTNSLHLNDYSYASEGSDDSMAAVEEYSPTDIPNLSKDIDKMSTTVASTDDVQYTGYYTSSSKKNTYPSVVTTSSSIQETYHSNKDSNEFDKVPAPSRVHTTNSDGNSYIGQPNHGFTTHHTITGNSEFSEEILPLEIQNIVSETHSPGLTDSEIYDNEKQSISTIPGPMDNFSGETNSLLTSTGDTEGRILEGIDSAKVIQETEQSTENTEENDSTYESVDHTDDSDQNTSLSDENLPAETPALQSAGYLSSTDEQRSSSGIITSSSDDDYYADPLEAENPKLKPETVVKNQVGNTMKSLEVNNKLSTSLYVPGRSTSDPRQYEYPNSWAGTTSSSPHTVVLGDADVSETEDDRKDSSTASFNINTSHFAQTPALEITKPEKVIEETEKRIESTERDNSTYEPDSYTVFSDENTSLPNENLSAETPALQSAGYLSSTDEQRSSSGIITSSSDDDYYADSLEAENPKLKPETVVKGQVGNTMKSLEVNEKFSESLYVPGRSTSDPRQYEYPNSWAGTTSSSPHTVVLGDADVSETEDDRKDSSTASFNINTSHFAQTPALEITNPEKVIEETEKRIESTERDNSTYEADSYTVFSDENTSLPNENLSAETPALQSAGYLSSTDEQRSSSGIITSSSDDDYYADSFEEENPTQKQNTAVETQVANTMSPLAHNDEDSVASHVPSIITLMPRAYDYSDLSDDFESTSSHQVILGDTHLSKTTATNGNGDGKDSSKASLRLANYDHDDTLERDNSKLKYDTMQESKTSHRAMEVQQPNSSETNTNIYTHSSEDGNSSPPEYVFGKTLIPKTTRFEENSDENYSSLVTTIVNDSHSDENHYTASVEVDNSTPIHKTVKTVPKEDLGDVLLENRRFSDDADISDVDKSEPNASTTEKESALFEILQSQHQQANPKSTTFGTMMDTTFSTTSSSDMITSFLDGDTDSPEPNNYPTMQSNAGVITVEIPRNTGPGSETSHEVIELPELNSSEASSKFYTNLPEDNKSSSTERIPDKTLTTKSVIFEADSNNKYSTIQTTAINNAHLYEDYYIDPLENDESKPTLNVEAQVSEVGMKNGLQNNEKFSENTDVSETPTSEPNDSSKENKYEPFGILENQQSVTEDWSSTTQNIAKKLNESEDKESSSTEVIPGQAHSPKSTHYEEHSNENDSSIQTTVMNTSHSDEVHYTDSAKYDNPTPVYGIAAQVRSENVKDSMRENSRLSVTPEQNTYDYTDSSEENEFMSSEILQSMQSTPKSKSSGRTVERTSSSTRSSDINTLYSYKDVDSQDYVHSLPTQTTVGQFSSEVVAVTEQISEIPYGSIEIPEISSSQTSPRTNENEGSGFEVILGKDHGPKSSGFDEDIDEKYSSAESSGMNTPYPKDYNKISEEGMKSVKLYKTTSLSPVDYNHPMESTRNHENSLKEFSTKLPHSETHLESHFDSNNHHLDAPMMSSTTTTKSDTGIISSRYNLDHYSESWENEEHTQATEFSSTSKSSENTYSLETPTADEILGYSEMGSSRTSPKEIDNYSSTTDSVYDHSLDSTDDGYYVDSKEEKIKIAKLHKTTSFSQMDHDHPMESTRNHENSLKEFSTKLPHSETHLESRFDSNNHHLDAPMMSSTITTKSDTGIIYSRYNLDHDSESWEDEEHTQATEFSSTPKSSENTYSLETPTADEILGYSEMGSSKTSPKEIDNYSSTTDDHSLDSTDDSYYEDSKEEDKRTHLGSLNSQMRDLKIEDKSSQEKDYSTYADIQKPTTDTTNYKHSYTLNQEFQSENPDYSSTSQKSHTTISRHQGQKIVRKNPNDPLPPEHTTPRNHGKSMKKLTSAVPDKDNDKLLENTIKSVINKFVPVTTEHLKSSGAVPEMAANTLQKIPETRNQELLPQIINTPMLRNLFASPSVENMVINSVRKELVRIGSPEHSERSKNTDDVIKAALRNVVQEIGGALPTDYPVVVEEHHFKKGTWVTENVTLLPTVPPEEREKPRLGETLNRIVLETVRDALKKIMGPDQVGLSAARDPIFQNIVVSVMQDIFKSKGDILNGRTEQSMMEDIVRKAIEEVSQERVTVTKMERDKFPPVTTPVFMHEYENEGQVPPENNQLGNIRESQFNGLEGVASTTFQSLFNAETLISRRIPETDQQETTIPDEYNEDTSMLEEPSKEMLTQTEPTFINIPEYIYASTSRSEFEVSNEGEATKPLDYMFLGDSDEIIESNSGMSDSIEQDESIVNSKHESNEYSKNDIILATTNYPNNQEYTDHFKKSNANIHARTDTSILYLSKQLSPVGSTEFSNSEEFESTEKGDHSIENNYDSTEVGRMQEPDYVSESFQYEDFERLKGKNIGNHPVNGNIQQLHVDDTVKMTEDSTSAISGENNILREMSSSSIAAHVSKHDLTTAYEEVAYDTSTPSSYPAITTNNYYEQILGSVERGPTDILEDSTEKSPIKYFSPSDRILEYIKKHSHGTTVNPESKPEDSTMVQKTDGKAVLLEELSSSINSIQTSGYMSTIDPIIASIKPHIFKTTSSEMGNSKFLKDTAESQNTGAGIGTLADTLDDFNDKYQITEQTVAEYYESGEQSSESYTNSLAESITGKQNKSEKNDESKIGAKHNVTWKEAKSTSSEETRETSESEDNASQLHDWQESDKQELAQFKQNRIPLGGTIPLSKTEDIATEGIYDAGALRQLDESHKPSQSEENRETYMQPEHDGNANIDGQNGYVHHYSSEEKHVSDPEQYYAADISQEDKDNQPSLHSSEEEHVSDPEPYYAADISQEDKDNQPSLHSSKEEHVSDTEHYYGASTTQKDKGNQPSLYEENMAGVGQTKSDFEEQSFIRPELYNDGHNSQRTTPGQVEQDISIHSEQHNNKNISLQDKETSVQPEQFSNGNTNEWNESLSNYLPEENVSDPEQHYDDNSSQRDKNNEQGQYEENTSTLRQAMYDSKDSEEYNHQQTPSSQVKYIYGEGTSVEPEQYEDKTTNKQDKYDKEIRIRPDQTSNPHQIQDEMNIRQQDEYDETKKSEEDANILLEQYDHEQVTRQDESEELARSEEETKTSGKTGYSFEEGKFEGSEQSNDKSISQSGGKEMDEELLGSNELSDDKSESEKDENIGTESWREKLIKPVNVEDDNNLKESRKGSIDNYASPMEDEQTNRSEKVPLTEHNSKGIFKQSKRPIENYYNSIESSKFFGKAHEDKDKSSAISQISLSVDQEPIETDISLDTTNDYDKSSSYMTTVNFMSKTKYPANKPSDILESSRNKNDMLLNNKYNDYVAKASTETTIASSSINYANYDYDSAESTDKSRNVGYTNPLEESETNSLYNEYVDREIPLTKDNMKQYPNDHQMHSTASPIEDNKKRTITDTNETYRFKVTKPNINEFLESIGHGTESMNSYTNSYSSKMNHESQTTPTNLNSSQDTDQHKKMPVSNTYPGLPVVTDASQEKDKLNHYEHFDPTHAYTPVRSHKTTTEITEKKVTQETTYYTNQRTHRTENEHTAYPNHGDKYHPPLKDIVGQTKEPIQNEQRATGISGENIKYSNNLEATTTSSSEADRATQKYSDGKRKIHHICDRLCSTNCFKSEDHDVNNQELVSATEYMKLPEVSSEIPNRSAFFGRISPENPNSDAASVAELVGSDLYYIGDGVKLPLKITRLKDGSFALSLSEKICESMMNKKCPCCVPLGGNIVRETKQNERERNVKRNVERHIQDPWDDETAHHDGENTSTSDEADELLLDTFGTSGEPERNVTSLHDRRPNEYNPIRKHKRRPTRSTIMPVEKFSTKYNLSLNLDELSSEHQTKGQDKMAVHEDTNVIKRVNSNNESQNGDLVRQLISLNEAPQREKAEILVSLLNSLIKAEQTDVNTMVTGVEEKMETEKSNSYSKNTDRDLTQSLVDRSDQGKNVGDGYENENVMRREHSNDKSLTNDLVQKLIFLNEAPQNEKASILVTTLESLIETEPTEIYTMVKESEDLDSHELHKSYDTSDQMKNVRGDRGRTNLIKRENSKDNSQNSDLVQKLMSLIDASQSEKADILVTTLKNLIESEPAKVYTVMNGMEKELEAYNPKSFSRDIDQDSNEHSEERAIYGYQINNPIMKRIEFIKQKQREYSECTGKHKYQKDHDEAITKKTELLKNILNWLKELVVTAPVQGNS